MRLIKGEANVQRPTPNVQRQIRTVIRYWLSVVGARSCTPAATVRQVDLIDWYRTFPREMINVTQNAARRLQSLLEAEAKAQRGLRVQISKGGCSGLHYEMALDERKPGDTVVERDGVEFFIDEESAPYLRGATLDFHDGLTGTGFQIVNPNAARTCGCGTSFEAA
jgi:iron-sulfur cluster assembly accessory protein